MDTKQVDWDLEVFSDIDGTPVVTNDHCLLIAIEKQYIPGHGGVLKIDPSRDPQHCVDWYYPTGDRNFSSWIGGVIGSVTVNDNYRNENDPYLAAFTGIDGMLTVVNYMSLTDKLVAGPDGKTMYPSPVVHFTKDIGPSISTPIFTGGHLVAAGYSGVHIFKQDAAWLYTETAFQPGMFEASPITHNGNVIIASRDGYLYCFGSDSIGADETPAVIVEPQHTDFAVNDRPQPTVTKTMAKTEPHTRYAAETKPVTPDTIIRHMLVVAERKIHASASFHTEPSVEIPVVTNGSYFLIAGVFRSEQNAINYTALWKSRGYPAEMITQPSGMHYVSLMRGETEQQLLEERSKMKAGKDPLPWVWSSNE